MYVPLHVLYRVLWYKFVTSCVMLSVGVTLLIVQQDAQSLSARLPFAWQQRDTQESVSILFTGDIMLGRYIKTLRERNGGEFPFTHMPQILQKMEAELGDDVELVVGNLEGPITTSNYVNPGTAMRFNFDPEVAELLADVGFTTLSMANNHTLDQGSDGVQQTHDFLAAQGVDAFGHPDTPTGPYSFLSYDFDTFSIGFLGLNDAVYSLDEAAALTTIQDLDSQVDLLIVGIHWGVEYEPTAHTSMVNLAHQWVDAGADLIWGHHPHVIQNSETYQGAPIYYSLGNFVFDQYWSQATQEGLVLGVRIAKNGDELSLTTSEFIVDLIDGGEPIPRD